ncbi:MAG: S24 family peptidase [Porphyromonadaceae bacterium]|nr:S24 family peptidase [Porphyromonadaceae bacterium]
MSALITTDFQEFIKVNALKKKDIAEYLGVSNAFITQLSNGLRGVPEDKIALIKANEKGWDVSMFLVNEDVEAEEDREELVGVPKLSAVEITDEEDYEKAMATGVRLIPEYDQDFRGGDMGELLSNVHPIGFWQIPTGKAEFVVSVSGDSMAPVLPSGSRIAVRSLGFDKRHPNSIPFGSIFAVSVEDPVTGESVGYVKYLRRHSDPTLAKRYWIARSANAECYDDFDIEIERVRALFIVECMMNRLV